MTSDAPMTSVPFASGTFTWLLGIEDTCVYPPVGSDQAALDEHVLTGHEDVWAADLDRAADLGATAIRYGVSWPRVHLAPGQFDWSHLDEVLPYATGCLGLTVVADLVHYGCPPWLPGSFADPRFPEVLAEFAAAFASRYCGVVDHVTPVNEPLTTASFCGLRGVWPPYLTGWDGWQAVTLGLAEGTVAAIRAIREANPGAVIVHVEAAMPIESDDPSLREKLEHLRTVSYLPTDLVLGRVNTSHPLWTWLLEQGADTGRLTELTIAPPTIDLLGVNYYPALSPRSLVRHEGSVVQVPVDRGAAGLVASVRAMAARYSLPIVITETSVEGDDDDRCRWLELSAAASRELINDGTDLRGITWWPLIDFVDWSYVSAGRSVEEFLVPQVDGSGGTVLGLPPSLGDPTDGVAVFLRRMGLIRLEQVENGSGALARLETGAAHMYRDLSAGPRPTASSPARAIS